MGLDVGRRRVGRESSSFFFVGAEEACLLVAFLGSWGCSFTLFRGSDRRAELVGLSFGICLLTFEPVLCSGKRVGLLACPCFLTSEPALGLLAQVGVLACRIASFSFRPVRWCRVLSRRKT
jgi:hypothetical protein